MSADINVINLLDQKVQKALFSSDFYGCQRLWCVINNLEDHCNYEKKYPYCFIACFSYDFATLF